MSKWSRATDLMIRRGAHPDQIREMLLASGAPACVACECANEPSRRERIVKRVETKRLQRLSSPVGSRGEAYRRMLWSRVRRGRVEYFHATKGRRWHPYFPKGLAYRVVGR